MYVQYIQSSHDSMRERAINLALVRVFAFGSYAMPSGVIIEYHWIDDQTDYAADYYRHLQVDGGEVNRTNKPPTIALLANHTAIDGHDAKYRLIRKSWS